MVIITEPTISEEEMDTHRSATYDKLSPEDGVPIEIISTRQNVLTKPESCAAWKFPDNQVVIFNVKFRIRETHDGVNKAGRTGDLTGAFGLTSDETIDWELEQNQTNRGKLLRDLIPFFGGWNAKTPGDYPVQANGTLTCPTFLVSNPAEFETQLLGATAYNNIKAGSGGGIFNNIRPVA